MKNKDHRFLLVKELLDKAPWKINLIKTWLNNNNLMADKRAINITVRAIINRISNQRNQIKVTTPYNRHLTKDSHLKVKHPHH